MANTIYTILMGKGVDKAFLNNFDTKFIMTYQNVKEDCVQILTRTSTPWDAIAKMSAELGDVDITHYFEAQDVIGSTALEMTWNSGKMVKSYVFKYDFDKMEYKEKEEIEVTRQYNFYSEEELKMMDVDIRFDEEEDRAIRRELEEEEERNL